jgi:hypothetical protein
MTVMAGGNQSVFGKDGALQSITSGDFKILKVVLVARFHK